MVMSKSEIKRMLEEVSRVLMQKDENEVRIIERSSLRDVDKKELWNQHNIVYVDGDVGLLIENVKDHNGESRQIAHIMNEPIDNPHLSWTKEKDVSFDVTQIDNFIKTLTQLKTYIEQKNDQSTELPSKNNHTNNKDEDKSMTNKKITTGLFTLEDPDAECATITEENYKKVARCIQLILEGNHVNKDFKLIIYNFNENLSKYQEVSTMKQSKSQKVSAMKQLNGIEQCCQHLIGKEFLIRIDTPKYIHVEFDSSEAAAEYSNLIGSEEDWLDDFDNVLPSELNI